VFLVFAVGLSLIMIAIRWYDFNERHGRKPKKTYFLSSLLVGVLAMGSVVLWYLGYFESATTTVVVSALLILGQMSYIAGRLPRQ
jgi:multisubunit Na+/H+ antiporter MnhB subunit